MKMNIYSRKTAGGKDMSVRRCRKLSTLYGAGEVKKQVFVYIHFFRYTDMSARVICI